MIAAKPGDGVADYAVAPRGFASAVIWRAPVRAARATRATRYNSRQRLPQPCGALHHRVGRGLDHADPEHEAVVHVGEALELDVDAIGAEAPGVELALVAQHIVLRGDDVSRRQAA